MRATTGADIGIFIKVNTGESVNHSESFIYKQSLPRLCADGTLDMRLCSICIPSICVNPYPPYAWKSRPIHNQIMIIPSLVECTRIPVGAASSRGEGVVAEAIDGACSRNEKIIRLEKMSIENKRLTGINDRQSSCTF